MSLASVAPPPPPPSGIVVAARPRPFELHRTVQTVPEGLTLAEIVERALPDPALVECAVVTVRGERIPREWWQRLRPKAGVGVEVVVIPQGGQGGRYALAAVVAILAVVATVYTGGALAGAGYGATAAALGGAIAGAAVSIAGTLAVNVAELPPG